MLGDDQLETGDVHLAELQQQLEQSTHRVKVGISLGSLHGAVRCLVDLLGREVDLGRLVDQQETRNWAVILRREQV